ncbi:MAG: hypothetical protein ABI852_00245 [Gemmatimonadaceae bacterium]
MFNSTASYFGLRAARNGRRNTRQVHLAIIALSLLSSALSAQNKDTSATSFEFRVTSGAFVPTGSQRTFLKDAQVSAAQLSWVVRPSLAITGTFGWARSRDLRSVDSPKLDAFTTDIGVESRPTQWFAGKFLTFSPFVGVGGGMRSYNYRKLDVGATNNLAGYGSVGGELGVGRVGLRLEVRDYATGFKPLIGAGKSDQRNDVVMMLGIRLNRHRVAKEQKS